MAEEEQLKELKRRISELEGKVKSLSANKGKKWKSKVWSRKLLVVLFFGTIYPILASKFTIPIEAVYIIIAYLLGQSSVDILKEWMPKREGRKE